MEPVDDANHIIMDYSIHDAIEAGFNHVVFIIRKDIEKEFKEVIGDRIASICSSHNVTVDYAFQDINDIPGELPEGRSKPWGTGQAVLAAKKIINTPFIVINADDYYGKEGFKAVHDYLVNGGKSCMAGFVLKNTLFDNGGVTRGICKMDAENNLTEVVETKNIVKTAAGAEADGKVIDVNSLVSMNMWGLTPDFLDVLEESFKEFLEKEVPGNPLKAEYLIPIFIGELLEQGTTTFYCRQWFVYNFMAYFFIKNEKIDKFRRKITMSKYFGTDGFRGEAGITLTADHAYKVGRFLGWYYNALRERNGDTDPARIVIGKDTRRSSYMFEYSLVAGLTASGADAYLLHVTTTPSVAYIARVDDFDCGIMISASHNPYYDNGIKLIDCYCILQ